MPKDSVTEVGGPTRNAYKLFVGGIVVTAIYVVALLGYAAFQRANMLKMSPDQFATFLSGVFAPLAFLWLVLGFRQQGDELQNSARALWLQGEELRNSVEQQRQLVAVSREQLLANQASIAREQQRIELAAQPQLLVGGGGGMYSGHELTLRYFLSSAGPTCSDVSILVNGVLNTSQAIFQEGSRLEFSLKYDKPEDVSPLLVHANYTDALGNRRAQVFEIPVDEHGSPNKGRTLGSPRKIPGIQEANG